MFYYPKSFAFKSFLTSQEVFRNVARFVLFEKTNTPNIGDLIAEALASTIFNNCDHRASTSERAGSIVFFAYGKNRAFPLDCVFTPPPPPPRGLAIPYMGNITIFGVQNGTCCVLVFVLNLKGKLLYTSYIMITFKRIFCSMLLNNM